MSYAKLRGKICEVYGTQEAFAASLGISKSALSMRLNNKVGFTIDEVSRIKDLLSIKDTEISAYFFTRKVR